MSARSQGGACTTAFRTKASGSAVKAARREGHVTRAGAGAVAGQGPEPGGGEVRGPRGWVTVGRMGAGGLK